MSIITTIANESKIITTAISGKKLILPDNYWRTRLCCSFFCANSRQELFRILQYNFCPLFWVSNFILLIFPIWFPLKLLVGAIVAGLQLFCNAAGERFEGVFESYKSYREARDEEAIAKKYTYNPKNPKLTYLCVGKENLPTHLQYLRSTFNVHPGLYNFPWSSPEFLNRLSHYARYYATFIAHCGSFEAAEQKLVSLIAEEKEKELRREKFKAKLDASIGVITSNTEKTFNNVYTKFKWFFQLSALLALIPLVLAVAAGIWYACGNYVTPGFIFVLSLLDYISLSALLQVGAIALITGAVIAIIVAFVDLKFFDNFIIPTAQGFAELFKPLAPLWGAVKNTWLLIISLILFVVNTIRMFFSENCPGIHYESEEK